MTLGRSPSVGCSILICPGRFNQILAACRPVLEKVYRDELQEAPPADIFGSLKLTGFSVEDPKSAAPCTGTFRLKPQAMTTWESRTHSLVRLLA